MALLINILLGFYVFISLLMVLVILMQRPKSEGLGAAFGGGVTENIFGAQTTNVLTKITSWLATLFFLLTFVLSILYAQKGNTQSGLRRELMKDLPQATPTISPAPSPTPAVAADLSSTPRPALSAAAETSPTPSSAVTAADMSPTPSPALAVTTDTSIAPDPSPSASALSNTTDSATPTPSSVSPENAATPSAAPSIAPRRKRR